VRGLALVGASLTALLFVFSACETDVAVDCNKGKACDDSFFLSVIPGGQGFEVGTYHFDIIANDETFTTDCYITGSVEATTCDALQPTDSAVEIPSFHSVRGDDDVITSFEIGFASAPPSVEVRVLFGNEQLADETYTEYEEHRLAASCPVLCVTAEEELTVLP
jgi:hypothetical protein